ncbi:MAG: tyrosine-type recombinase/integrase [Paraburkholderia fungorum]|nr:tyrosine-type recombinase/integrase [Paraburkholderia fungorum]
MGTITERVRKDKSIGYTAQIRLKQGGRVVHTEAKTFDRKPAAQAWLDKRERELAQPGALESAQKEDPPLSEAIDRYMRESKRDIGRTKKQVLDAISAAPIGQMKCSEVGSREIVQFAQSLEVQPQTAANYISHLAAVFNIARPAWGYPLDMQAMDDARKVMKRLGTTSKSAQRNRRPTLDELDKILNHFQGIRERRPDSAPMVALTAFAIFSTRRLDEMCRIEWPDFDEAGSRVLVRDLKHPGQKIGNDVWCDLVPEAVRIIKAQPRLDARIFPYGTDAVGMAFTRACQFLAIDDLHLHDMRHEGASRLFEMGWNIPHVAAVTGHRSWTSLKRYTHIRQTGDKFAGWKWLDVIAPQREE